MIENGELNSNHRAHRIWNVYDGQEAIFLAETTNLERLSNI